MIPAPIAPLVSSIAISSMNVAVAGHNIQDAKTLIVFIGVQSLIITLCTIALVRSYL